MQETTVHSSISGRNARPLENFNRADQLDSLLRIGIDFGQDALEVTAQNMGYAMDALQAPLLSGTQGFPVQEFQEWLQGWVAIVTAATTIDEILGVQSVGSFESEEVIQGILELTGKPQPYGDYNNIPLSSFNPNYERRTNVRFEEGARVGFLEGLRAARVNLDAVAGKRDAAALALNITRNAIGFFGYNSQYARTYGLLNDPNLPAYSTVATGASSQTTWASKTYLEITADIRVAMAKLRTQSGANINPNRTSLTLVLPTTQADFLSVNSTFGNSVNDWLTRTYPNLRIVSCPEFVGANGGSNVFYLFADTLPTTGSTDNGGTFVQLVTARNRLIGSERRAKSYIEDYGMSTAGVLLKRPFAVVRYSGI